MKRIAATIAVLIALACTAQAATPGDDNTPPTAPTETVSAHAALADCPEIVFIKRHHVSRPFGIGTMYAWKCYSPGGGIYAFDPLQPEKPGSSNPATRR
jgi:hypothetical protein